MGFLPPAVVSKKVARTFFSHSVRRFRLSLHTVAIVLCLCTMTILFPAGSAYAVEGGSGVYAPGLVGPQAGMMPDPGTYVGYNLYYYKGDSTTDVSASGQILGNAGRGACQIREAL
jgi:hypothetical protein